ncbi:MAG: GNAT family N-acetyltransferase [Syntrophales bacterium]
MNLQAFDIHTDPHKTEAIWNGLCSQQRIPYFLSWGWIENWISSIGKAGKIKLAYLSENNRPLLGFFLGENRIYRNRLFSSRGYFLNTTGIPRYDALCIEYNAIPCADPVNCSLRELLDLIPGQWDELYLPGMDSEAFPGRHLNESVRPYKVIIEKIDSSPYVDLSAVRKSDGGYFSLLSSNTRAQVRRSYRELGSKAPVVMTAAGDLAGALKIYEKMVYLHQKNWQAKGEPGAFASDFFYRFHRNLIRKRFKYGEIQLLEISSGGEAIGCLYNFVFRGKVYFYQSGFNYEIDRRLKPGYVCHAEAIKYNAEQGHSIYDFLAGSAQYKSSMATSEKNLIWARIQKPLAKFWLEKTLENIRRQ